MMENSKKASMAALYSVSEKNLAVRKGEMIEGKYSVLCDGMVFAVQNNIEQSRKNCGTHKNTTLRPPQTTAIPKRKCNSW